MVTLSNQHEILGRYVKDIWSYNSNDFAKPQQQLRFFADGCPGIMFQEGTNPMMIDSGRKLANVFLYGQTVAPIVLSTRGSFRTIVAILQPDALGYLFGTPANELTDTCLDLNLCQAEKKFSLIDQMLHAETLSGKEQVLKKFLTTLIVKKKTQSRREIRYAIDLIHASNGNKNIIDIARELQISERSLERKFEQYIGVAPKVYSSIYKFHRAMQRLEGGQFESLTALAYDLGYADQSHFNRWFKLYAGETPLKYLRKTQVL